MGEAKRRALEIGKMKAEAAAWRESLTDHQKLIADVAIKLDDRLVRGRQFSGGCYHLAFFMAHHLSLQGVDVQPVIGWVNDGLWLGMTSHAWIEFDGRITDTSLTYCERSNSVPTGALIVHDKVLREGEASYTYHHHGTSAVQAGLDWLGERKEYHVALQQKLVEHERMRLISANRSFQEYFSSAPPGGKYADLLRMIS
jgi:hypothetical protein